MKPDSSTPTSSTESTESPQERQLLGYGANGQPLYGTPAQSESVMNQEVVSQPAVGSEPTDADTAKKHDESVSVYSGLNLNSSEYVISEVQRHSIGIALPVISGTLAICALLAIVISYPSISTEFSATNAPHPSVVALIGIMLSALVAGFTYMSVWIFRANRMYLTNQRIIQNVQKSLFWKRVQTITLANIEDASYRQNGVVPTMFGYGAFRLSTVGDENTYRLNYVVNPGQQIEIFNQTIENFKKDRRSGR